MRWEEMSWDKVRRAQMRWSVKSEVWGVKCEVWSVKCEVWSVKCEVWSVKCEVWTVKCEVWSVKCEVWSVECAVGSVQCEVWSVECGVWSVECEAWSAKWSFKCDMWNRTPLSQSARTHGLGWRTAHASSIDEKGLIYIFKATSAPPRAGTTGILKSFIWYFMQNRCTHGSWALCISIVCSFPTPFPDERAVRTKSKLQYISPLDPGV